MDYIEIDMNRCFSLTKDFKRCKRKAKCGPLCTQHKNKCFNNFLWYPFLEYHIANYQEEKNEYPKMEKFIEYMEVFSVFKSAIEKSETPLSSSTMQTVLFSQECVELKEDTLFRKVYKDSLMNFRKQFDILEDKDSGDCCVCLEKCDTTRNCCNHNICQNCYVKITKCPLCRKKYVTNLNKDEET